MACMVTHLTTSLLELRIPMTPYQRQAGCCVTPDYAWQRGQVSQVGKRPACTSRCATASRRDFAWRQGPDGQRAAPLLTHLVLLWHNRQVDRIVGHRVSKGKTTVFMIDGSFPKKSFIGPK